MNRFIFTMAMMKQIYLSWELKFCVSVKLGHEVVCDSRPRRSTFHRISSAGSTASHRVVCSVCVDYWFASRPGPKASGKYLLPWLFVVVSGSGPRESGLERAPISLICLALRLHLAFIFTLYETQTLGIIKTKKYYKQLLGVLRSSAHTCDLSAQLKMKKQTPNC